MEKLFCELNAGIIGTVSYLVSLTISPRTWLPLKTRWADESCFGSSSRLRLEACRIREQEGVDEAVNDLVREERVEGVKHYLFRRGM